MTAEYKTIRKDVRRAVVLPVVGVGERLYIRVSVSLSFRDVVSEAFENSLIE